LYSKENNSSFEEEYESDNCSDYRLLVAIDIQNKEQIKEEDVIGDLEAELISALIELRKVRKKHHALKEEMKCLKTKTLKSDKLTDETRPLIIDLKVKLEEKRLTEEVLNNMIMEKDKENEILKYNELINLRNKLKDKDTLYSFESSSKLLNQIIDCQRPTTDKSGLGYKQHDTDIGTSTTK